ncbi:hypothetical protein MVEN_01904800 [Mycena venus]|uniref:Uncharacterized protein n=1 Tax=Mycena venus TaxID=2733690 RepID=A0A8H6XEX5_9AGAR|nr:hypothetical protein MVEN_01904800 [Mycena venus]
MSDMSGGRGNVSSRQRRPKRRGLQAESAWIAMKTFFLEQEAAHHASETLLEQGLPALDLPLCIIAYEVQDVSDDTWRRAKLILLPSWPIIDGPTRRIAYQFVQLTHDPIVLYLSLNHTLRGSLKPNNKSGMVCAYPAPMGISAASVHILPRAQRRIFTQPPPEILSAIFGCAIEDKYRSWRPTLISFALVCRDWVVALEHLFHDFGSYTSGKTAPDLVAVSKCVQAKPQLGKAIWYLSRSHFGREPYHNEQEYLDLAIAFKNVLYSAQHVRQLEIFDTHSSLREEFVEALRQSRDVRSLLINSYSMEEEPKYRCRPTLPDLFRCFQRWSRLHELKLFGWDGPNPFLQTVEQFTIEQTPPLDCALRSIQLFNGPITGPQLCNLTAGSHSSLSDVHFSAIIGLSNAGLKDWLLEVACTLRQLNIEKCSIAKTRDDEEYALDAVMSHLTLLSSMRIEGDVLSELAVLRKTSSSTQWKCDSISFDNCPGVNPHGLVQALKYTGWHTISARRIFEGNKPLLEEGKAIAKERGLNFW